jgi:Methyltransferase domain
MNSMERLKTLAHYTSGGLATLRRTPIELWRGYNYGRKFTGEKQPYPEPESSSWLEDYFDELTVGPGVWKWKHYLPIYERHLSKYRGKEVHILEVGIYSGGSLGMWHSYFGDKAHVYGVDIEPACRAYEDDRTKVFIGDQADPLFWEQVIRQVPKLDVVIDDGGHRSCQQIATLEAVLPHLQPGGVYLCEDVYRFFNTFHAYVSGLSRNLHTMRPTEEDRFVVNATEFQRTIGSIHLYPFVTVIERCDREMKQFTAPKRGTEWQSFGDNWFPDAT